MPKTYDIGIKKTIYGFCQITAKNEEEANQKASQIIKDKEGDQIEFFEDDNSKEVIGIDLVE